MNKEKLSGALLGLHDLVSRLRGPGGCPWDAQQTPSTIKMYLLEEAYEVLDAIEKGAPGDVCEELGDLLFQIIFLTHLAEEGGEFDLVEVIETITEKMIKRHPHVFGVTDVKGPEEVAEQVGSAVHAFDVDHGQIRTLPPPQLEPEPAVHP